MFAVLRCTVVRLWFAGLDQHRWRDSQPPRAAECDQQPVTQQRQGGAAQEARLHQGQSGLRSPCLSPVCAALG